MQTFTTDIKRVRYMIVTSQSPGCVCVCVCIIRCAFVLSFMIWLETFSAISHN